MAAGLASTSSWRLNVSGEGSVFGSSRLMRSSQWYYAAVQDYTIRTVPSYLLENDAGASFSLVRPVRIERTTHSLEGCCSIQLSYGRVMETYVRLRRRLRLSSK